MRPLLSLILATLALAVPALAQQPQGHGHGQGHGSASHAIEMNQRWTAPDVDVADWARRFENPERDVIANRDAIVAAMRLSHGEAVADIGAGTGAYLAALSRAVGPEGHVFAVDISAPFAAHMAARAEREQLQNVSVLIGRADNPTLPAGRVDAVLTVNTFHHFEAPQAMLRHIHRALRPGGQFVVVDFDRASPGATGHQRQMARLDKAGHVRLIEAHGFRLVEDVAIPTLRQNFMLRFERP